MIRMSLFVDHPRVRWAVPGAVLATIGAVALAANQTATADPSLSPRTAAQLLVDVQGARLSGLSGTVVQTSNLGLPELPGLSGAGVGGGSSSLTSMISGTHTWRVWYAGQDKARVALVGSLGESDVIRNGTDVWVWSSKDKTATHSTVARPSETGAAKPVTPELPTSPQAAADQALKALDPTTLVTTSGTASVAGRDAYELVLKPRQATTLVAEVRISVDATEHIPLRVQVYAKSSPNPAFEVSFSQVDFAKPDASSFTFNPPPGTKVTQSTPTPTGKAPTGKAPTGKAPTGKAKAGAAGKSVKTVGSGWSTIVVDTLPQATANSTTGRSAGQLAGILRSLPKVSGSWGTGRVLRGTLFSAVIADDGRVAVGAVPPELLYAALAAR